MAVAEQVAREAGALVREGRPERVRVSATKSSDVDPVTAMDLAAEDLIRRRLRDLRPQDGVLGEEHGLEPGVSGLTWVVDPIDGTVNYLYGIPAYAISIGVVSGEPDPATWTIQAGCVHAVADGRTWTAAAGHGAWRDGRRLAVSEQTTVAGALVGTGFGYTQSRRRRQAQVVAALLPLVRDVRRIGSAALDLALLAEGALDAHYERGLNPWDLA
ncbi:MAG TPA: inositol monophosphatase family protein, partial [Actinotalea sp.]|nr:inositol monophosphatase family protein [Actinotalea sp.]